MAFIANNTEDENQGQQGATNSTNNAAVGPSSASSSSAPSTGGGAAQTQSNPSTGAQVSAPGQGTQSSAPAQRQGSGRFTNLQQYVTANQGAGNTIASNVQKNVNQQVQPNLNQTQQSQTTGQNNINNSQNLINTGNQLNTQMSASDFTPDQAITFAQNGNNLQNVNNFENGSALDNTGMANQNQIFQNNAATLANQTQGLQQQAGTELGRTALLQSTYGGQYKPAYSTGQSYLDNLLLQGTQGALGNLQSGVGNLNNTATNLQNSATQQGSSLSDLANQATTLGTNLTNTTNNNIANFKTGLTNEIPGYNTNLDNQTTQAKEYLDYLNSGITNDQFDKSYGTDKTAYGGNSDLWNQLGLTNGEQTFNVLNNPNLGLSDIATINAARAQNWQDVANQQNVNQYGALAQLANTAQGNYELTAPTTINSGYTFNTGDTSLQGQINAAKQQFLQNAQTQNIAGGSPWAQEVKETSGLNLNDFLTNQNFFNDIARQTQTKGGDVSGSNSPTATGNYNLSNLNDLISNSPNNGGLNTVPSTSLDNPANSGTVGNIGNTASGLGSSLMGNPAGLALTAGLGGATLGIGSSILGNTLSGISSSLGMNQGPDTAAGQYYDSVRDAGRNQNQFYNSNLGVNLNSYLQNAGFGNYLTQGGVQQVATPLNSDTTLNALGYRNAALTNPSQLGIYNPTPSQNLTNSAGADVGARMGGLSQLAGLTDDGTMVEQ